MSHNATSMWENPVLCFFCVWSCTGGKNDKVSDDTWLKYKNIAGPHQTQVSTVQVYSISTYNPLQLLTFCCRLENIYEYEIGDQKFQILLFGIYIWIWYIN